MTTIKLASGVLAIPMLSLTLWPWLRLKSGARQPTCAVSSEGRSKLGKRELG